MPNMESKPNPRQLKKPPPFRYCLVCGRQRTIPARAAQLCDICMASTATAVEAIRADVDRLARHWGSLADALDDAGQQRFAKMLEVWSDAQHGTTIERSEKWLRFRHRLAQTVGAGDAFAELCHAWWNCTLRSEDLVTLEVQLVVMADDAKAVQ
jgi:hypothetical protein